MLNVYRAGTNPIQRRLWEKLLNAVLFQTVWFVCVLAGDSWALISVSVFLLVHWLLITTSRAEWLLIVGVVSSGIIVDSVHIALGVLTVIDQTSSSEISLIPIWLICIWLAFSLTLCHSLSWLQQRLGLAVLLGAVSVPLSYWAGIKLGAMELGPQGYLGFVIMAGVWSLLLPTFCFFAAKASVDGESQ